MKIVLASAHPYLPQIAGGAQSNMHEVVQALTSRGHQVSVLAGLTGHGWLGVSARLALKLGRHYATDTGLGYAVHRRWLAWEAVWALCRRDQPDVALIQSGMPAQMAAAFRLAGVPCAIHFHNVEEDDLEGMTADAADHYISNSEFTAKRTQALFGVSSQIIVPTFLPDLYRTRPDPKYITFINPHPKKGVRLMVETARRLPEKSFLFVKSWTLSPEDLAFVEAAARSLANITLREPTSDMRSIYAQTALLALPSQWEEAWGRVATEAHFSGIPVIGSARGGIPESIGPGGVLLPPEADASEWAREISAVLDDPRRYAELSAKALSYAERAEIDLDQQIDAFEEACRSAIRNQALRPGRRPTVAASER